MAKKIGVLVELDYCVGCSACQLACQDYYQLPVTETYMRCFLGKPDVVDGRHEMFMSPYAYRLLTAWRRRRATHRARPSASRRRCTWASSRR